MSWKTFKSSKSPGKLAFLGSVQLFVIYNRFKSLKSLEINDLKSSSKLHRMRLQNILKTVGHQLVFRTFGHLQKAIFASFSPTLRGFIGCGSNKKLHQIL